MQSPTFLIRQATAADIPGVVAVEEQAWAPLGTEIYTADHFAAWLETNPQLFLIAVRGNEVVSYINGQHMHFSREKYHRLTNSVELTDHGFTRRTNEPGAKTVYGVSLASTAKGAGHAVLTEFYVQIAQAQLGYFSFPRIALFDDYMKKVEAEWNVAQCGTQPEEADIALWYVHECAKLMRNPAWKALPPQPTLTLPALERPDPILQLHLKLWPSWAPPLRILGVLRGFMRDPQSRNYSVCISTVLPGLE